MSAKRCVLLAMGTALVLAGCTHSDGPVAVDPRDAVDAVVFRVEGLACSAVEEIGCGQLIDPVLARLDGIAGVDESAANWTGTLIRVSLSPNAHRAEVQTAALKILKEQGDAALLSGDELRAVLQREKWLDARRIHELSAFEYRTLSIRFMRSFAEQEKLDRQQTEALVKAVEEAWAHVDQGRQPADATGWRARFAEVARATSDRIKPLLTAEQLERFQNTVDDRIKQSR